MTRFIEERCIMRKLPFIFLLILSLVYSIKIVILSYPLLINQYPFISPDGFDWITEGYWLSSNIQGANISPVTLPTARPPLFVIVTALDSFLGQNGYGIALVFGLSFFRMGYFALKSLGKDTNPVFAVVMLIALLLTPVNFVRKWILSDAVCVFLSFGATYYLFELYKKSFGTYLQMTVLSMGIAFAGATQTYGLISPLIGISVLFFIVVKDKNISMLKRMFYILFISVIFWALILFFWYRFIPHHSIPTTFGLIKLSLDMSSFYFNTWSYFFLHFIPLLFVVIFVDKNTIIRDSFLVSLWLSVVSFMVLAFFYQWRDSRFTFLFWHLFVVAIFKTYSYVKKHRGFKVIMLGLASMLIVFQSFFLSADEWQPNLRKITINPQGTWLSSMVYSVPVDRFHLKRNCGVRYIMCDNMTIDDNFDGYVRNTMRAYMEILR